MLFKLLSLYKLITQPKEDRFLRNNSAEKYCRETTKTGKDAARWDLNLSRQNFSSTMNSSRVILKKLKKSQKLPTLSIFWNYISAHGVFPDTPFVAVSSKYSLIW